MICSVSAIQSFICIGHLYHSIYLLICKCACPIYLTQSQ
nr:MAG TPA: hypothetical protein [Caudoviricetes sp.]